MTLYDLMRKKQKTGFMDYTFLYNPDIDYAPIKDSDLVARAWGRVGNNMRKSFTSFVDNRGSYVGR